MEKRTVLLATDLSSRCDRALDRAVFMAREIQARLVIVHAIEANMASRGRIPRRPSIDPKTQAMERVLLDVQDAKGIDIDVVVEPGEPVDVILKQVVATGCELILTGVARDETLGRSLLGTTVEKLTRNTSVPILVVKSRPRARYAQVLVGTDFSEGSRRALEIARAQAPGAHITLFHAYDVVFEGMVDDKVAARGAAEEQAFEDCRNFLAETPSVLEAGQDIAVACEYGDVAMLMQDFVILHKMDLVVLGTEGRSRIAHMLVGSTAQRLLEVLPVDVLVVRRG